MLMDGVNLSELLEEADGAQDDDVSDLLAALGRGVGISEYAAEVQGQLKQVESASIDAYIREDENLKNLHKDIRSCDEILAQMEHMLGSFQSDLTAVSDEIRGLQTYPPRTLPALYAPARPAPCPKMYIAAESFCGV